LVKEIFQRGYTGDGAGALGGVGGFLKRISGYDKATQLEATRKKYEDDLKLIFDAIEMENKAVGELV